MEARVGSLFRNIGRYLFAIATVAAAFALRWWLIPFTGAGAPFVLFFAAVLVTSLYAGVWPGICALLISLPLATYTFVMPAGYARSKAAVQALLFAVDGLVVVYLTFLMRRERRAAQDANRQLREVAKEERLLADAGTVLASSLDYEQTLATVAQLVVREFADWCMVEIMEENETFLRLKVASADPANATICTRFEQLPIDRNRPYLVRDVVEKKQALLIEHVSSEHLEAAAQNLEHLQALRAINPTSLVSPRIRAASLIGMPR
jgi:K+-sensing histidine kinase KdpD